MADILGGERFVSAEPITKGWSGDKKYCVALADGTKYLLRVSPIERYEMRKGLFAMMERVAELEIRMCRPIEFGTCSAGVYSLQNWIDGEDLEPLLPGFSEAEQYALGFRSGEIVRKMHGIPAPEAQEPWAARFRATCKNLAGAVSVKKRMSCVVVSRRRPRYAFFLRLAHALFSSPLHPAIFLQAALTARWMARCRCTASVASAFRATSA